MKRDVRAALIMLPLFTIVLAGVVTPHVDEGLVMAKGKPPPAALFNVEVFGDVSGGPKESNGVKENQSGIPVGNFPLDLTFFQTGAGVAGLTCPLGSIEENGTLFVDGGDPNQAEVTHFFRALGTDGVTVVRYVLRMFGTIDNPGDWLPADSNTITLTTWTMEIERKRDKKISCTGSGEFSDVSVDVVRQ